MSDLKTEIIDEIIRAEGGYVDDPNDSGGATNYGITEAVARAAGWFGHMRDLPRELAFDIYSRQYWDEVRGDELEAIDPALAREVVDTAVNMGAGRAGEFLQRALNVFNTGGTLYADITVDGAIGPATIRAVEGYAAKRAVNVLVKALNCLQGAYYIDLAERRAKDENFVYGWLRARVTV